MSRDPLQLRATFDLICDALEETGLRYAFIGALAATTWGRIRTTTDIDFVVQATPEQYRPLAQALRNRGFTEGAGVGPSEPSDPLPDMAIWHSHHSTRTQVDVFIAKLPFELEAIQLARTLNLLGRDVRLVPPEASIIYKLLASRRKDLDDVDGIFAVRHQAGEALDWALMERWARDWEITDRLAPYRARYGPP